MKTQNITQIPNLKLSWRHIWIVFVAMQGQIIGTALATIVGVIIPMIQILSHTELPSWLQGLLGCIDLIGIAVGSIVIGRLTDRYGYLTIFRLCPLVMFVFCIPAIFIPDVTVLLVSLFMIGFATGGEYSLDSNYISELMPDAWRSFMVGVAKAASAVGNIAAAGICWLLLLKWDKVDAWPKLMWIIAILSGFMFVIRIFFAGSPKWLIDHGRKEEAYKAAEFFFGKNVVPVPPKETETPSAPAAQKSIGAFVKENYDKVVLSGIPWACEGLGVYGIGVFLPILVMALGLEHFSPDMSAIRHVASSVEVTFWISCLILPGFVIGLAVVKKLDNVKMLYWGFYICAAALLILMLAYLYKWDKWISISAFMVFELALNIGPHLITYILPPKIYPVADRGQGSGIAASLGKIGAVVAVFFIPMLLKWGGAVLVLAVSVAVMVIGGLVASVYGPKVKGAR